MTNNKRDVRIQAIYEERKYMEIISFDEDRIQISTDNSTKYINKKTSQLEVENLKMAREYLNSKILNISNCEYSIEIPKIKYWDEEKNLVKMDFFDGNNLESMLRSGITRKEAIIFLNKLLEFILVNDFYWVDFSPRNILINKSNKKICFVDFEKGLSFKNDNLIDFFRNHVFEEYSSFLFLNERILNGKEIFKLRPEEEAITHGKDDIKIKRVKATANKLNYPDIITRNEFLEIYRMFLIAELPQKSNGNIIFPRVELEKILETKKTNPMAYDEYADRIIQLVKKREKEKKINY